MGLLHDIQETLGPGQPAVSVTLDNQEYHWNDTIHGSVHVTGGSHDRTMTELLVRVVEHVNGGRNYSRWNTHTHLVLSTQTPVPASSHREFSFRLRIPEQGAPTHEELLVRYEWYVEAEAHFPHVLRPINSRAGFVMREPPVTAAVAAMKSALLRVAPFRLREEGHDRAKVCYRFDPPPSAAASLDAVELVVEQINDRVRGSLRINRKEHSLTDHLKAIVHNDITEHPLNFSADPLTKSHGGQTPPEVIARLEEILQPFL